MRLTEKMQRFADHLKNKQTAEQLMITKDSWHEELQQFDLTDIEWARTMLHVLNEDIDYPSPIKIMKEEERQDLLQNKCIGDHEC